MTSPARPAPITPTRRDFESEGVVGTRVAVRRSEAIAMRVVEGVKRRCPCCTQHDEQDKELRRKGLRRLRLAVRNAILHGGVIMNARITSLGTGVVCYISECGNAPRRV